MACVASWEVLAVDDIGPGTTERTRRFRISTIAALDDETLRPVQVNVVMTPTAMERWQAAAGQRPVTP